MIYFIKLSAEAYVIGCGAENILILLAKVRNISVIITRF